MTIKEMIKKLQEIANSNDENLPVYCSWTENDEDGEEYEIKEEPLIYLAFNEVWITY